MKLYQKRDYKRSGIYLIKNLINNKVYIGKSINIHQRISAHINLLNKKSPDENRYLINAWFKYGRENFQYIVLEDIPKDDSLLKERELYWIKFYNSTNRNKGYNLRIDTSTNCIVHKDTRKLMSQNKIKKYKDFPELKLKISIQSSKFWKENPKIKEEMIKKVSDNHTEFHILQYDKKTKEFIKRWEKVKDIIKENPSYKVHNIYAVCSGEKPTMYGYIWIKILKDDIVHPILKDID